MRNIVLAGLAVIGLAIATSMTAPAHKHYVDCDGYGARCAYPIKYPPKKFVRNAIEEDTARRAKQVIVDMTVPPVKFQDRLANN